MKQFEYVVTVADCGSISKAADKLYLNQSALSRYITKLESELGFPLFNRTSKGICLTAAGEIYADYGRRILSLNNAMSARLCTLGAGASEAIQVGMTLNASCLSSARMHRMLRERYPNCKLVLSNIRSVDTVSLLRNRDMDFVVAPALTERCVDINQRIISEEYLLLMVPERWDLSPFSDRIPGLPYPWIDLRRINDRVDYIVQAPSSGVRRDLEDVLTRYGITINAGMETINSTMAIQAASAQLGCCFVTETFFPFVSDLSAFQIYCIGTPPKRAYSVLYWLNDCDLTPERKFCMDILTETVRDDLKRITDASRHNQ